MLPVRKNGRTSDDGGDDARRAPIRASDLRHVAQLRRDAPDLLHGAPRRRAGSTRPSRLRCTSSATTITIEQEPVAGPVCPNEKKIVCSAIVSSTDAATVIGQALHPCDHGGGERAQEQALSADRAEREPEDRRTEDRRDRGEQAGETPDDERDAADADAEQPRALRVLGRRPRRDAVPREPEEQREPDEDERRDDEHDEVVGREVHAAELERRAERTLEPVAELLAVDVRPLRRAGIASSMKPRICATPIVATVRMSRGAFANRRTIPELDEQARKHGGDEPGEHRGEVGPVVDLVQLGRHRRGERAELALREVDDAVRPVDEHEADREQRAEQADDEPLQVQAVRDRRRVRRCRGR